MIHAYDYGLKDGAGARTLEILQIIEEMLKNPPIIGTTALNELKKEIEDKWLQ